MLIYLTRAAKTKMADDQQRRLIPTEEIEGDTDYGSSSSSRHAAINALSPVDEERQSRPKAAAAHAAGASSQTRDTYGHPPHQSLSAALEQAAGAAPAVAADHEGAIATRGSVPVDVYQSATIGPLTPPRSPWRSHEHVPANNSSHNVPQIQSTSPIISYQTLTTGPLTPPRAQHSSLSKGSSSSAKRKSRKNKSKSSSKRSSSKKGGKSADSSEQGGGVTSSIKRSLSNLSLYTDDDETASLHFGSTRHDDDDDLTSAHHRAELYGAIGGPTGMIGAFGERRGCKRFLFMITLAFILLSLVLQSAEQRRDAQQKKKSGVGSVGDFNNNRNGTNDSENENNVSYSASSSDEQKFLIGEIGELTPGKCRQIIDKQSMDVADATAKMEKMAAEIKRLERQIVALQSKVQTNEGKQGR